MKRHLGGGGGEAGVGGVGRTLPCQCGEVGGGEMAQGNGKRGLFLDRAPAD